MTKYLKRIYQKLLETVLLFIHIKKVLEINITILLLLVTLYYYVKKKNISILHGFCVFLVPILMGNKIGRSHSYHTLWMSKNIFEMCNVIFNIHKRQCIVVFIWWKTHVMFMIYEYIKCKILYFYKFEWIRCTVINLLQHIILVTHHIPYKYFLIYFFLFLNLIHWK